jgi:hypothetical protein
MNELLSQEKCLALKMRALRSSDLSGANYPTTRLHIPEDLNLQQQRYEKKISQKSTNFSYN